MQFVLCEPYEDIIVKVLLSEYQVVLDKSHTNHDFGWDKPRATLYTLYVEHCIAASSSPSVAAPGVAMQAVAADML